MLTTLWHSASHSISLSRPPSILSISGRSIHGLRGPEHYRLIRSWGIKHGMRALQNYRVERFWVLNLFQGEGELRIDGKVFPFRPGYAGITWPGPELVYTFRGKTIKTWAHFVPCEKGPRVNIPVMQDLGAGFDLIRSDLQSVSSLYRAQPERAVSRLWDILWRIIPQGAHDKSKEPHRHPMIARAMDEIDMRLPEAVAVSELARKLETSQTHLNRLFKAAIGATVSEYVRGRRMEWARHLLSHTTMPIKAIAHQIGIPDAQHFNKMMRRYFGRAPRALREG